MVQFFANTRPGHTATHGNSTFELPVLYYRDDFFALYFTADAGKIKSLMPSDNLHPVRLSPAKGLVAIGAFNYIDTTIGPYGEVVVGVPVVYGKKPPSLAIPALIESRYPGFGVVVLHLPVTNLIARDAGRGQWGYTKFTTNMDFTITPEYMECCMTEKETHILTLRVGRSGIYMTDTKPLNTFSVLDHQLIETTVAQKGTYRMSVGPKDSFLQLGDHPVAKSISEMGIARAPLLSKYYVERAGILPAGKCIERNVRALDGYRGADEEGSHSVSYQTDSNA